MLTAKIHDPSVEGDSPLDIALEEVEEFIGFADSLSDPFQFNDAGNAFEFPLDIKIFEGSFGAVAEPEEIFEEEIENFEVVFEFFAAGGVEGLGLFGPIGPGEDAGGGTEEGEHRGATFVVGGEVDGEGSAGATGGEGDAAFCLVESFECREVLHFARGEAGEVERDGAGADGGEEVVGIGRGTDDDEVGRGFFEDFEERIGGLFVGAIDLIDEEDTVAALERVKLSAFLESAHLLDGDLAERAFGAECDEVGVRLEEEGIVVAFIGGHFFAFGDGVEVVGKAEVILLDGFGVSEEAGGETTREGGFADAFGAGEEDGLGDTGAGDHLLEDLGGGAIAVEVVKHWPAPCGGNGRQCGVGRRTRRRHGRHRRIGRR